MLNRFLSTITIVALLLGSALPSLAASVTIVPAGSGTYIVKGDGMSGVAGIDLLVSYSAPLSNPTVSQGGLVSGALFAANPNYPPGRSIKIGIVSASAFSGSGDIAVIKFGNWQPSAQTPTVTYSLVDSKGASTAGTGLIDAPGIPFSQPETPATTQPAAQQQTTTPATGTTTTTTAPSTSPGLGGVTIASDPFLKGETRPAEPAEPAGAPAAPPADTPASTAAAAATAEQPQAQRPDEPKRAEEARTTVYGAVLERFRAYQGEKSPAILAALFKKDVAPAISQEPHVALSDGKTSIRIMASLTSSNGKSPNFALNGAKLVSLKKGDEAGIWIIEALPRENVLQATLTILNGAEIIEYPLTVAPPINSGAIGEAAFNAFLKNSGKGGDLNNDGRRDFTDEYIYTANYLVRLEKAKEEKRSKEPKK